MDTGDGVKFTIDQSTGMLSFRALADFEEQIHNYIILVADDGYNYTNHNVSITLNNLNEPPIVTAFYTPYGVEVSQYEFRFEENGTGNFGQFNASHNDYDPDRELVFSISEGFYISGYDRMYLSSPPNYEEQSVYEPTLSISDGDLTTEYSLRITIEDQNEKPQFTSQSNFIVEENTGFVGYVQAVDEDGDIVEYAVLPGNNTSGVQIDALSGLITLDPPANFEEHAQYQPQISATDNLGLTTIAYITIDVLDVDEPPEVYEWRDADYNLLNDPIFRVSEDFKTSEYFGAFKVRDPEGSGDLTFSISQGFYISGYDKLYFDFIPDYETKPVHNPILSITLTIQLLDVEDFDLDIDGNGQYDALSDGLLILRSMFGLRDDALIAGTIGSGAIFENAEEIQTEIDVLGDRLDIDDNGSIDALTDGLLILRYLFGLSGDTLTNGVIGSDANRTDSEQIEIYISTLTP